MGHITLDILRSREDMLTALVKSKLAKSIIGIKAKALGPGTYMTTVLEIVISEGDDDTIVLKGYDMTGYFFDRSSLKLEEIESVIPFTALFGNPFLRDFNREVGNDQSSELRINMG